MSLRHQGGVGPGTPHRQLNAGLPGMTEDTAGISQWGLSAHEAGKSRDMTRHPQRKVVLTMGTAAFAAAGTILWFLFTMHSAISLFALAGVAALIGYAWAAWLSQASAGQAPAPEPHPRRQAVPVPVPSASPAPTTTSSGTGWPDHQPTFSVTGWA